MNSDMKISIKHLLFIGNLSLGSNAKSLCEGFKSLNWEVIEIDTSFYELGYKSLLGKAFKKIAPKQYENLATYFVGKKIQSLLKKNSFDYLFVFKGLYVPAKILSKNTPIKIHYHPDDSSNPENINATFTKCESLYDFHFTSKLHNIQEIFHRTGKPVKYIRYAYDKKLHHKVIPDSVDFSKAKIGFIGTRRPDRIEIIQEIAKVYGKEFMIAGLKWNRERRIKKLALVMEPVFDSKYRDFILASPIQLGFLNSENRDTHTARTFEIPATGAVFILQDSSEHREIFTNFVDVLFFKEEAEIFELIEWVRQNPVKASSIAIRCHLKITSGKNSWDDRAAFIAATLEYELKKDD